MKKRDLHWLIYLVILLGIPLAVRPTGSLTQLGVYALAITVSTLYAWLTIGSIETSLFIYGADDRRGRLGELCPVVPHRHSLHRCDAAHHDALRGAVEAQCAGLPESGRSGAGGGRRPPAQGGQDRPGRADLRRRGGGHVHAALPGGCGRDGVDGRKHEAPGGQPAAGGDHPHSRHPGRDHDQFPLHVVTMVVFFNIGISVLPQEPLLLAVFGVCIWPLARSGRCGHRPLRLGGEEDPGHVPAAAPDGSPAEEEGKPCPQGHHQLVVQHLPQGAQRQGENRAREGDAHALESVDPCPEALGEIPLHRRLAHGGAVDAQEACHGAVDKHQGIGDPE